MKILTTISMATCLAVAGFAGAAAAEPTDPSTQPALAQADATPPAPAAAADGSPAGAIPTVDQTQAPAPAATVVAATVTNGPIPDTPANRARYGGPMSHAGKKTAPAGN